VCVVGAQRSKKISKEEERKRGGNMKDKQGHDRGSCTDPACVCVEYLVPRTGVSCDYCGHPPGQHQFATPPQPANHASTAPTTTTTTTTTATTPTTTTPAGPAKPPRSKTVPATVPKGKEGKKKAATPADWVKDKVKEKTKKHKD